MRRPTLRRLAASFHTLLNSEKEYFSSSCCCGFLGLLCSLPPLAKNHSADAQAHLYIVRRTHGAVPGMFSAFSISLASCAETIFTPQRQAESGPQSHGGATALGG